MSSTNICLGTYDGSVAGMTLQPDQTSALTLTTNFAYGAHAGAIRSAALHGSTLVTGGVDENVHIYDLSRRVEVGTLLHHDGTINSLVFAHDAGQTLLFSASTDSSITVWNASEWTPLKRLLAHRASVLSVAVHPSMKVALSASADRALYMWNLARGKVAFSAKTKGGPAQSIAWSACGAHYVLAAASTVTLSNVEGRTMSSFVHNRPVSCSAFLSDGHELVTGADDGVVRRWDARSPETAVSAYDHASRVVSLAFEDQLVISADARGGLKIWDVRRGGKPRIETNVAGGVRLTCMAAAPSVFVPPQREPASEESLTIRVDSPDAEEKTSKSKRKVASHKTKPPLEGTASQRKRKKRKLRA